MLYSNAAYGTTISGIYLYKSFVNSLIEYIILFGKAFVRLRIPHAIS